MSEREPQSQPAFELPGLSSRQLDGLTESLLLNPNLGAGIDVSGVSGSGKSNYAERTLLKCASMGIPFIHIDPHGDSAQKVWRMCLQLPERIRSKILYWKVADPNSVASINPLLHAGDHESLSDYERNSRGRIQVELTAEIILAAVGEAGQGFANRPVMRKWMTRWLWMLWRSRLTLADAAFLIDPHHPIYDLLLQLAPDELSRQQMQALSGMKVSDLEAEIGSARNRLMTLIEHPASMMLLSRRQNTIDFRRFYDQDVSIIVDLGRGGILSDEVQRLVCNIVLTNYLSVVFSTPQQHRRRRICVIDELPVFSEACAPLLEKVCTEVRKYLTSFIFLHQGTARFPDRENNPLFRTIFDMCRVKVHFRHGVDAEFFGKQVALAAHRGPKIKHVQKTPQQFTIGHEVVELVDQGEGTSEMEGQTLTEGTSSQISDSLSRAVHQADQETQGEGRTEGNSKTNARQSTSTRTTNRTIKQTLVPTILTREVISSLQFYSKDEIEWAAASAFKQLETGEAIITVDGQGVWQCQTPVAKEPLEHAPKFASRKLNLWRDQMLQRPEFVAPETVQQEREHFLKTLTQELQLMAQQQASGRLESTGAEIQPPPQQLLIEPIDDDGDPQVTF